MPRTDSWGFADIFGALVHVANGFLKRNAANTAWEEVAYGTGANTVAQGNDARFVWSAGGVASLGVAPAVAALVDAATIAIDAGTANYGWVVVAGNRIVGVPANGQDGESYTLEIRQDAVGNRILDWTTSAVFEFAGPAVQPDPAANAVSVFVLTRRAGVARWRVDAGTGYALV